MSLIETLRLTMANLSHPGRSWRLRLVAAGMSERIASLV